MIPFFRGMTLWQWTEEPRRFDATWCPYFQRHFVPDDAVITLSWKGGNLWLIDAGRVPEGTRYSVRIIGRCNLFNNALQNTYCCLFVLLRWMYDTEVL